MMKKSDDLFSCFDTIPACDTDRRQTSCHRIVRAYAKHRAVKNIILISFVPSHSMFTVTRTSPGPWPPVASHVFGPSTTQVDPDLPDRESRQTTNWHHTEHPSSFYKQASKLLLK